MRKLIFTHSDNFVKRFGTPALAELQSRLELLSLVDKKRGIDTAVLYVDDARSAYNLGVNARANNPTVEDIAEVVDAVNRKNAFDFFLIIGGDEIVPMFRYANPIGDDDKEVISDNGYAISRRGTHSSPYLVERAIGRLPNGLNDGPEIIWRQLDEIEAHASLSGVQPNLVCFSAALWEIPSLEILKELKQANASIYCSPPVDIDQRPPHFDATWASERHIHFFNLHGSLVAPQWLGQLDNLSYPSAYQPSLVPKDLKNCLVVSEACYGADIVGSSRFPRSLAGSVCLTCLSNGAAGFCGSSTIAYGATNRQPILAGADLLVLYFLTAIRSGMPQGSALLYAKARLASEIATRDHVMDVTSQKTLLQFQLYGDPSLVLVSDITEGKKVTGEFQELISQARTGRLSTQISEQLASPVADSGAKKSIPEVLLTPPKEFLEFKPELLSRHSEQLKWTPPGKAISQSTAGGGAAAQMMYQASNAIWYTEIYALGEVLGGQRQFLVRVLKEDLGRSIVGENEPSIVVSR